MEAHVTHTLTGRPPLDGRGLCAFNRFIRTGYVDAVLSLPWDEARRDRGASWGSLAGVLLHCLEVEEYWFHHVIAGRMNEWVDWDLEHPESAEAVRAAIHRTEERTRAFLASLDDAACARLVEVPRDDGSTVRFSVEEILAHVAVEEMHHRGELIALLWQMDVEPPPMTLLRWVRHMTGQPL
jgi:uncharacterized damage-inducible protein DinB